MSLPTVRPIMLPTKATAALGAPNRGYTFDEGLALSTDEDDVEIHVDEFEEAIIP